MHTLPRVSPTSAVNERKLWYTCGVLLQLFGRMNKTIEGQPIEEGASYINKYFLLPTNLKATDKLTFSLDEGELEEGYYHMSAKVCLHGACRYNLPKAALGLRRTRRVQAYSDRSSVMTLQVAVITKYPSLVDLQGPAKINQTDVAEMMGFTGACCGSTRASPAAGVICVPFTRLPCSDMCRRPALHVCCQSTWASW